MALMGATSYWLLLMNVICISSSVFARSLELNFTLSVFGECNSIDVYIEMGDKRTIIEASLTNGTNTFVKDLDLDERQEITFTWTSSRYTDEPCCWSILNVMFSYQDGDPTQATTCNNDDINRPTEVYQCNDHPWVCAMPPRVSSYASSTTSSSSPLTASIVSLTLTTLYSHTANGQLEPHGNTSCRDALSSVPRRVPTEFPCYRGVCEEDGKWIKTSIGLNATVDGACYNGSATGIRRCGDNGMWDNPSCIVSTEFTDALSRIEESTEEGLENLLKLIMSDSNNVAPGQLLFLLETVIEAQRAQDEFVSEEFIESILRFAAELIKKLQMDTNSNDESQRSHAARLLLVLDDFALMFVRPSNNIQQIETISLSVLEVSNAILNEDVFSAIRSGQNFITLPTDIVEDNLGARIASFIYQNVSDLLPPRDDNSSIVSPIISSTTNCGTCSVDNLTNNVTIQLKLEDLLSVNDNISCVFFDFKLSAGDWSSSGCTTSVDGDIVTCSCNHLTHFAILLSPGLESQAHFEVLNTIGLVLVPISLLCMVLVILTYACIRSLWSIRSYIHIMLCVSLFMAQLVFIIGIDKIKNEGACSAVAVLLQYLFLVTFMWMLMEGVVLYVTLVRVFIHNYIRYIIGFTATSYVVPAVYMVIVVPIGFLVNVDDIPGRTHYLYFVDDDLVACWLNSSTGFISVFIVPVCLIILVNVGFFIMAIVIMRKHFKKQDQKSKARKFSYWLRGSICLTLIMGITWVLGLLAFSDELLVVAYIYTVYIAGQGILLFILLVLLSNQVRDAYLKCFKRRVPYSETVLQYFSGSGKETITNSDKTLYHKKSGGITLGSFGGDMVSMDDAFEKNP